MNYNTSWLLDKIEQGYKPKYLFFWGHQPSKDGSITKSCFSQWWESSFVDNNTTYKTSEHWMMAEKARLFKDPTMVPKIINANSPGEAKKLGRRISNFDQATWDQAKYDIVVKGNTLKFSQNNNIKTFIINTNERVIVEASPVDSIWGNGLSADSKDAYKPENWRGENLLGFALMEVRDF